MPEQEYCHQIPSSCPRAHLQHQLVQLIEGTCCDKGKKIVQHKKWLAKQAPNIKEKLPLSPCCNNGVDCLLLLWT